MKWKKLGKLFEPDNSIDWIKTHAMIPLAEQQASSSIYKIYFSPRDSLNRSQAEFGLTALEGNLYGKFYKPEIFSYSIQ